MRPHPRECRQENASLPVVSRPVAWLGMLSRCPRCHPNHNILAGGDLFKIAHPGRDLRRIGGRSVPEIRRPSSASPAATSPRQSASPFSSPMEPWRACRGFNVMRDKLIEFSRTSSAHDRAVPHPMYAAPRAVFWKFRPGQFYTDELPKAVHVEQSWAMHRGVAWRRSTLAEGKGHARSWSGCCPLQADDEVGELESWRLGVRFGLASLALMKTRAFCDREFGESNVRGLSTAPAKGN
jgi:hypothetical protein